MTSGGPSGRGTVRELQPAIARLDRYVQQRMQAAGTAGMALALTDRQGLLHLATYGYSDVAARAPVTETTLFEIGSISKSFTSVALMQLREAGLVDLHQPVTRYLPWFAVQSRHPPITLHHLLSHSSGIIRGMEFTGEARYEVWALRETQAIAPPGTYYHYSNVGYKALGVILEDLLHRPYGDILQERILNPLGMTQTDPIITHETRKRMAVGYEGFYDDRPAPRDRPIAPATWLEFRWGDGSVASTPADMAAYLRMYLNLGRAGEAAVLSQESVNLMMEPVIEAVEEGRDGFYGYGLDIDESDGRKVIGHGGGMVGYYAYILADMRDGLGAVALSNGPECGLDEIVKYGLELLRARCHGEALPSVPQVDSFEVDHAVDYVGSYTLVPASSTTTASQASRESAVEGFRISAEDKQLYLDIGDQRLSLERRGLHGFQVDHPRFARFLLHFGRDEGNVVEAYCGPDWYVNERYAGPHEFDHPAHWTAYPGQYRSHNPWDTNFRVVLRKGQLKLIHPRGEEKSLVPVEGGQFRVGDDDSCPERMRFDVIVENQALRANYSCGEYYRAFKHWPGDPSPQRVPQAGGVTEVRQQPT